MNSGWRHGAAGPPSVQQSSLQLQVFFAKINPTILTHRRCIHLNGQTSALANLLREKLRSSLTHFFRVFSLHNGVDPDARGTMIRWVFISTVLTVGTVFETELMKPYVP